MYLYKIILKYILNIKTSEWQDLRGGDVIFQALWGSELIETRVWGEGEFRGIVAASWNRDSIQDTHTHTESSSYFPDLQQWWFKRLCLRLL